MKSLTLLFLSFFLFTSCSSTGDWSNTRVISSTNGDLITVSNSYSPIRLGVPRTPDLISGLRDFSELYEEGRGQLELMGLRTSAERVKGTVSYYSGVTEAGERGTGLFFQGDVSINMHAEKIDVYVSKKSIVELEIEDLTSGNESRLVGDLVEGTKTTTGLQVQGNSLESAETVALVCNEGNRKAEICGFVDLQKRRGLIGNTDWQGARGHNASGGFRIYRSPRDYDLIIETDPDYKGDAGPDLYWYFSSKKYQTGVRDGRYSEDSSSIILSNRLRQSEQRGSHIHKKPGSALIDLKDYKTVSLWCDKFSVLFQYSQLKDL